MLVNPVAALLASVGAVASAAPSDMSAIAEAQQIYVEPIIVVTIGDEVTADKLHASLNSAAARSFITLGKSTILTIRMPEACVRATTCSDAKRLELSNPAQVHIFAYRPGWRSSDHLVRCVGYGSARTQTIRLNLADTTHGRAAISYNELAKLANCIERARGLARGSMGSDHYFEDY
jgi:hypothetical protein